MKTSNKLKLINDPIYGFITIPNSIIFNLIEHPYFQRLRRITQMGLSYLVYPGAHHTRFHHALGSMFLMQKVINVLRFKSVVISDEEEKALYIAILLHDIGHSPFSHALEHSIVKNVSHETISLLLMQKLNTEFNGALELAIQIFKSEYKRPFLCQLISSQLDMDRSDYLKRDSFYTGIAEGNVNSERLIVMLNVVNDHLVVEEKGIHSVEKFLIARRFMYWQVYLHKTSLAAEQLLIKILQRAKQLYKTDKSLPGSSNLLFFLEHDVSEFNFKAEIIEKYVALDDVDVIMALKQWQDHPDFVLQHLSKMLIKRNLLKVKIKEKPISAKKLSNQLHKLKTIYNLTDEEANYFVFQGQISNQGYNPKQQAIKVLTSSGKVKVLGDSYKNINVSYLTKNRVKYYICYPKELV